MPFEAALVVAFIILVASLVGILIFAGMRRRAAKEEELRRVASARGWTFATANEKGYRVHRWSGSTDGVSWQAESLRYADSSNKTSKRRQIARWHGAWSPGISGAVVCMGVPKGKENLGAGVSGGEGYFAKLAQKPVGFAFDKAIDLYFGDAPGKEVDAGAMQRVEAIKVPGYVVMAADKGEGERILAQGLEAALIAAAKDTGSMLADDSRPWILLRPRAVSLARTERIRDVNELERLIRAGVEVTRAFKFGRPTS